MEPTVFTDVEDHMFIAKEESFGPVMVVSKFKNGYAYVIFSLTALVILSKIMSKKCSRWLFTNVLFLSNHCSL